MVVDIGLERGRKKKNAQTQENMLKRVEGSEERVNLMVVDVYGCLSLTVRESCMRGKRDSGRGAVFGLH